MNKPMSLYRDGKIYDAMNDSLVEDTHFYLKEFHNVTGSILELACETGRITCALASQGNDISGLDLSESMLIQAKQKSKDLGLKIEFHSGDMTRFDLKKKFDIIFVAYNSVHHILRNEDLKNFLRCVKDHLNPKGRFLFDIFNPSLPFLVRPKERIKMDEFIDPHDGQQVIVTEDNIYDPATQINHVTYYYSKKDQPDYHSHPLDMRCYFPQEMDALLNYNGFEIRNNYGGFDKSPFTGESVKQIFDCTSKGKD